MMDDHSIRIDVFNDTSPNPTYVARATCDCGKVATGATNTSIQDSRRAVLALLEEIHEFDRIEHDPAD
jgi:hypothetical protein